MVSSDKKNTFIHVRIDILICLFLVVSILAVYGQVRNYEFINYDDGLYVSHNPHIENGLNAESIYWAFTTSRGSNWHPITWLSHMLDVQLYGMDSGRHHMINVLFHIINSLLLFIVFRKTTGAPWKSGFIAAMFALHPLHVESVAWVSERKDVLSTFFFLLTILSYILWLRRSRIDGYLAAILFFILGLMAKPMLVTLPFVLLLFDFWPLCRTRWNSSEGVLDRSKQMPSFYNLVLEKTPFFALSVASCVMTLQVEALYSLNLYPFKLRIANALISYVGYIRKMIWPIDLACIYPYLEVIPLWQALWSGFVLLIISFSAIKVSRRYPYILMGWLWYLGTLVPVIGLVQIGLQSMADRYTYLPLIGLFIIVTWGVPEFLSDQRLKKLMLAGSGTSILILFGFITYFQVKNWESSIRLFEHAIAVTKENYVAHHKLGEALEERGRSDAAIQEYSEALRIRPKFILTRLDMGAALRKKGRVDDAIKELSFILHLKPDIAEAHYELGLCYQEKGDFEKAIRQFNESLRLNPDDAKTHNILGVLLARRNQYKEALFQFHETVRIDAAYAGAYYNIGKIFVKQGKMEEAVRYYQKALFQDPDMPQALYNLAWIFSCYENDTVRNGEEAVNLAERLCNTTHNDPPIYLDVLAAAYADVGRFEEAVSVARKALELALHEGPEGLVSGIKRRLKQYQKGFPCREAVPSIEIREKPEKE